MAKKENIGGRKAMKMAIGNWQLWQYLRGGNGWKRKQLKLWREEAGGMKKRSEAKSEKLWKRTIMVAWRKREANQSMAKTEMASAAVKKAAKRQLAAIGGEKKKIRQPSKAVASLCEENGEERRSGGENRAEEAKSQKR